MKNKKILDIFEINSKPILTFKEVAYLLQISESELRKLMKKGEIKYFEIGEKDSKRKIKRFKKSDVDNYININYK